MAWRLKPLILQTGNKKTTYPACNGMLLLTLYALRVISVKFLLVMSLLY